MKFTFLSLLLTLSFAAQAQEYHSVHVSTLSNFTRQVMWAGQPIALAFQISSLSQELIIECKKSHGVVGFSEGTFVGYNRIRTPVRITSEQCQMDTDLLKAGRTLTFEWLKQPANPTCGGYVICDYRPRYSIN